MPQFVLNGTYFFTAWHVQRDGLSTFGSSNIRGTPTEYSKRNFTTSIISILTGAIPETWSDKDVVSLSGMRNKLHTGELVEARHGPSNLRLLLIR